jgi:hypothetical protein
VVLIDETCNPFHLFSIFSPSAILTRFVREKKREPNQITASPSIGFFPLMPRKNKSTTMLLVQSLKVRSSF